MSNIVVVAPLISAFVYAFAALALKRATTAGVGPWRVCFVTNWIQALLFSPFFFLGGNAFSWTHFSHAALAGCAFYIGQVFTFLAISRGDVSVVTPVLGTKVVLVAIFVVVLLGETIPNAWWLAAVLTVVATALLGGGGKVKTSELTFRRSVAYGFIAATMFSLTDIMSQHWAREWGVGRFLPTEFLVVGLLSFTLVPAFHEPLSALPRQTWFWLVPGSVLLSLQALGIAFAIMTQGHATLVNILYASRGLWTIATVWLVGHWFGNDERSHGNAVLVRRLIGSALILFAVILAVKK